MPSVVVDTHAAVWMFANPDLLGRKARVVLEEAITSGVTIWVSAVSVVEVTYLVDKHRLPGQTLDRLIELLTAESMGLKLFPVDLNIACTVRKIPLSEIPDMPDRIIAATALFLKLPLVTRDHKIRASKLHTIW